jgi:hypothetical protein
VHCRSLHLKAQEALCLSRAIRQIMCLGRVLRASVLTGRRRSQHLSTSAAPHHLLAPFEREAVLDCECQALPYEAFPAPTCWSRACTLPPCRVVSKGQATLVCDPVSYEFVRGSTIDYTTDIIRSAFEVCPEVQAPALQCLQSDLVCGWALSS